MEQMKNCFTLISIVIKSFENSLKEFNLPFVLSVVDRLSN